MEAKRMRSPGYPGMTLSDAIETIEKMFSDVRVAPVDREVAARAMGYSGITGRSGKVLSDLVQYGLLEKVGKNEVRVSSRAVEIMHPDHPIERAEAVLDAAFDPVLFQELRDRFPDAVPSENALRSYLVKRGFTDAALQPAIRAYVETCRYAEQFRAYESHGDGGADVSESVESQQVVEKHMANPQMQTAAKQYMPPEKIYDEGPQFNMVSRERVILGGAVRNKADAQQVVDFMNAIMALLPEAAASPAPSGAADDPQNGALN